MTLIYIANSVVASHINLTACLLSRFYVALPLILRVGSQLEEPLLASSSRAKQPTWW